MSKVVLKSVQDRRCLKSILEGSYKPDFKLSYGWLDEECSRSYRYMLDKLSEKTRVNYIFGEDTCIWSWYRNPFFRNHVNFKNFGVDLVVITFEIDESQVVFSDFDRWGEMLIDGWGIESVVELNEIEKDDCIQAVSWSIPVEGILSIEPFNEYMKRDMVV